MYMGFYLLTWAYFNDVNGGKKIIVNFNLKYVILLINSDKKKWNKFEKDRKKKQKTWANKMTPINVISVNMKHQV